MKNNKITILYMILSIINLFISMIFFMNKYYSSGIIFIVSFITWFFLAITYLEPKKEKVIKKK